MSLVKTTFKSDLEAQFKTMLQPAFEYLFITLSKLSDLPVSVKSKDGDAILVRQLAIDGATANAKEWSDRLSGDLAQVISDQVDTYIKTGTVTTPAGVAVATTGTAAAQTGATTAPGIGSIS